MSSLVHGGFVLAGVALLGGCGHFPDGALKPHVVPSAKIAFAEYVTRHGGQDDKPVAPADVRLEHLKRAINALRNEVDDAADLKGDQSADTNTTTLLGASAITIGAVAEKVALRNTGVLLSFIGITGAGYYKTEETQKVHDDTADRLRCLQRHLAKVDDADRDAALQARPGTEGLEDAQKLPAATIGAVDRQMGHYRDAMRGVKLVAPSREALSKTITDLIDGEKTAAAMMMQRSARADAAAKAARFINLLNQVNACVDPALPPE